MESLDSPVAQQVLLQDVGTTHKISSTVRAKHLDRSADGTETTSALMKEEVLSSSTTST